ncbi:hypothetical protein LTS18_014418, partial [Coniosporium uncinatum]
MPLKSKITNPAFSGSRSYSDQSAMIEQLTKAQPSDEADDVLFSSTYGVRHVELNRPKKLNSLNGSMARKIIARMKEWERSELANVILISGAGRAFCAGGDVAYLAQENQKGPEGQQASTDYFGLEYKLDHLIATYNKPYIAFLDGITMGGGVGLSVHAPFRIATDKTVFAMPETTIGFFPDVGASFFLTRMEGGMGCYLALTSEQLKGVDVLYHGVATHYLDGTSFEPLKQRLGELQFPDHATLEDRHKLINSTLAEFATGLPSPRPALSGELRRTIDHCFDPATHASPLDILRDVEQVTQTYNEEHVLSKWARKTIATIRERSPISVAVSLRQMQVGRQWDIAETFKKEYNIAAHFMRHPDFVTGVSARLINKTKERPQWKPNQLEDVTREDVDAFFESQEGGELELLNTQSSE